jgi:hypothetical protein
MKRDRAGSSLHELLLGAVERAEQAQAQSCALIDRHHAVTVALDESVERIRQRRARTDPAFGNGHQDARIRSRPG